MTSEQPGGEPTVNSGGTLGRHGGPGAAWPRHAVEPEGPTTRSMVPSSSATLPVPGPMANRVAGGAQPRV